MVSKQVDYISNTFANSFLIFAISLVISAVILALILNPELENYNLWIGLTSFTFSFILSIGYNIRSILKEKDLVKKIPANKPPDDDVGFA